MSLSLFLNLLRSLYNIIVLFSQCYSFSFSHRLLCLSDHHRLSFCLSDLLMRAAVFFPQRSRQFYLLRSRSLREARISLQVLSSDFKNVNMYIKRCPLYDVLLNNNCFRWKLIDDIILVHFMKTLTVVCKKINFVTLNKIIIFIFFLTRYCALSP